MLTPDELKVLEIAVTALNKLDRHWTADELRALITRLQNPEPALIYGDIPVMTAHEQYEMRVQFAMSHEDGGKCRIYGDDGELQCNNISRHGRMLDFRREPISALLETVQLTRLVEYAKDQAENPSAPKTIAESKEVKPWYKTQPLPAPPKEGE